ncbi:hypothetical protein [Nocardia nova]|jgi:hypothetical protein|uniref:hypothetical protein n=1 Tax=Nocardia nova TaxID=37330 RepID=UPI00189393B2|nr:hypothetical protein [Nocardia nova]MBF6146398.1 hypothetical protein [Nocardia nova]MDN2497441.1 hypothetical protein [Nocardia nova]
MGRPFEPHGDLLDIADLSLSVTYLHHVILRAVFGALTLQGLFDVSPMRDVPAPDAAVQTPQRALSENERGFVPATLAAERRGIHLFTLDGRPVAPIARSTRWLVFVVVRPSNGCVGVISATRQLRK